MKAFRFLPLLVAAAFGQSLTPSSTAPGTKEEAGIVTTMALHYNKLRNTVRDMYQSIQYGKAMIQAVDDQRAWFRRNMQGWRDVNRRVVRLVEDPGRWDKKLMDLEEIFDRTDVLLFEEPRRFDALLARQERYVRGIGVNMGEAINYPLLRDFYDYNSSLYREGESRVSPLAGADPATNEWLVERERQRLADAKGVLTEQESGRVRDAAVLAASQAQAQLAALKAMQRQRSQNYASNHALLAQAAHPNTKEMAAAFSSLKSLDAELDQLVLRNIELQLTWAHLGTEAYDLSTTRSTEIKTAESMETLSRELSK
ncbi:MAG TPA: hypothetical protein VK465_00225 [Fibrobacteria bacterium]|nr:hypothetical protein [Fibrobacteria bacterium]